MTSGSQTAAWACDNPKTQILVTSSHLVHPQNIGFLVAILLKDLNMSDFKSALSQLSSWPPGAKSLGLKQKSEHPAGQQQPGIPSGRL